MMRKGILWAVLCAMVCLGPLDVCAQSKKNVVKQTKEESIRMNDGTDRALWVKWLWKIAYPMVHHLAEGNLYEKMPLEVPPGYSSDPSKLAYLEGVGRTLAGLAPWLSLPDDDTEEGKLRKQMREEVLKGLKNAVDPDSPDRFNFEEYRQPIVDAAFLVHGFIRAPKALWEPLDDLTKQRYIAAFKSLRNRAGAYNNWLLFSGLTEAFLLKIGEECDPFRIWMAVYKMKEWYAGDGWYRDGDKFSMDYYNAFVIHSMFVDLQEILYEHHWVKESDYKETLRRMVRHAEFSERIIGPDGTFPAFGRSITYRSAAFQSLADVALRNELPEHVLPSQVRCALTAVHRNMYDGNQNFDQNGWLILGFNGHQPEAADTYTNTGSLYMATLSFLPLGLPADHPFWTDKPADWTSKKAWKGDKLKKDYKVEY